MTPLQINSVIFATALISPVLAIFVAKLVKELLVVVLKAPTLLLDSAKQYFSNIWDMIASYSVQKAK